MSTSPPSEPHRLDPWSYPSEAIELPTTPPELLVSPAESAAEHPRRRRLPVLVAVATVVALLLGGVAYAGARLWYGSGTQPEEATPSTVVAFARLDLSPGYGQRLKVDNLLKKFPREGGKDSVDELKQGIFDSLDIDEAVYRAHVEPWFADRIGVALWLDADKHPYGLVTLAASDEAAARAGLTEVQRKPGTDKLGFVVRDGYALVAKGDKESQAAAEAAGKDAERESLGASAPFRRGADWLPARQIALAWVDLTGLGAAVDAVAAGGLEPGSEGLDEDAMPFGRMGSLGGSLIPGMDGLKQWSDLKGQMILGGQATDDGVEVRFRSFDTAGPAQTTPADARSTVDALPGNSAVAASFRVGELGDPLAGRGPDPEMLPEEALEGMPAGEADEIRERMRESRAQVEAMTKGFSALSGAKLTVAVSNVAEDVPALVASAETTSAEKAATLARSLKLFGEDVTVTESGNKIELKTAGYVAEGGLLGDQALYREALDGAPEEADAVVYIDVQRLLADSDLNDKERAQAKPVKAVGLATGTEDGDVVGLLRVIVR